MGNGQSVKERLTRVETQVKEIKDDVGEIKCDVKKLLVNGASQKGKRSVWDKVLGVVLGALAGFFAGKWG